VLSTLALAAALQTPAQPQELAPGTRYDPNIPTLEQVVGHDFGEVVADVDHAVRLLHRALELAVDEVVEGGAPSIGREGAGEHVEDSQFVVGVVGEPPEVAQVADALELPEAFFVAILDPAAHHHDLVPVGDVRLLAAKHVVDAPVRNMAVIAQVPAPLPGEVVGVVDEEAQAILAEAGVLGDLVEAFARVGGLLPGLGVDEQFARALVRRCARASRRSPRGSRPRGRSQIRRRRCLRRRGRPRRRSRG